MLGDFPGGQRINSERVWVRPQLNSPARRTTHGAPKHPTKPWNVPKKGGCHRFGYTPAVLETSRSRFLRKRSSTVSG